MKQDILFNWFREKYEAGDKGFFSIPEVEKAFKDDVDLRNIRTLIIKLYAWGYLDINTEDIYNRKYRIKLNYVNCPLTEIKSPLSKDLTFAEFEKLFRGK